MDLQEKNAEFRRQLYNFAPAVGRMAKATKLRPGQLLVVPSGPEILLGEEEGVKVGKTYVVSLTWSD